MAVCGYTSCDTWFAASASLIQPLHRVHFSDVRDQRLDMSESRHLTRRCSEPARLRTIHFMTVCHPPTQCVESFTGLAVARLVLVRRTCKFLSVLPRNNDQNRF